MARLLTWLPELGIVSLTPLNGPNARGSGANSSSDGGEQTFEGIGDVLAFQLDFSIKQGVKARRERGLLTGLLGGANAMRFKLVDGDRMTLPEAGVTDTTPQTWANGETWSNGMEWAASYPTVAVGAAAAVDTGIVTLADEFWGLDLNVGDVIGFFPFHFGAYTIWDVVEPGQYRIWPRLRVALTTDDYCTLVPTIALRPTGKNAVQLKRGLSHTEGQSVTLVEVIDPYVRSHFAD